MVAVFSENETVMHLEEGVIGVIDTVYEFTDPDTDRPTGEPHYDIAWNDGNYSTHLEHELVGLSE